MVISGEYSESACNKLTVAPPIEAEIDVDPFIADSNGPPGIGALLFDDDIYNFNILYFIYIFSIP